MTPRLIVLLSSLVLPIANAQASDSLASATYDYLAKHGDNSHPTLRTFSFDLNEDGHADAIALLTGNEWSWLWRMQYAHLSTH